jgi:hypothetical protein
VLIANGKRRGKEKGGRRRGKRGRRRKVKGEEAGRGN